MWECQLDTVSKADVDLSGNVDSYSLLAAMNPRDARFLVFMISPQTVP